MVPAVFLGVLESTGLIVDVGAWVLQRAARDLRHGQQRGFASMRVAVNVSPLQFRRGDFVELIRLVRSAIHKQRPVDHVPAPSSE